MCGSQTKYRNRATVAAQAFSCVRREENMCILQATLLCDDGKIHHQADGLADRDADGVSSTN